MKCCFSPLMIKGIWVTNSDDTSIYPAHAHMNPTMKNSFCCCLLPPIPGATPAALMVLAGTRSLLMYIKKCGTWQTTLPARMSACWQNSSVNQGSGSDPGDRPSTETSDTDGCWPTAEEVWTETKALVSSHFPDMLAARYLFIWQWPTGYSCASATTESRKVCNPLSCKLPPWGWSWISQYHVPALLKHLTLYCRTSLLSTTSRGHTLHGVQLPCDCQQEIVSCWSYFRLNVAGMDCRPETIVRAPPRAGSSTYRSPDDW